MASDTVPASEFVALREQLCVVLTSQEGVARAVAELKDDMAPLLGSLRFHSESSKSAGVTSPPPAAAAHHQEEPDGLRPSNGVGRSQPAAEAPPPEGSAAAAGDAHGSEPKDGFATVSLHGTANESDFGTESRFSRAYTRRQLILMSQPAAAAPVPEGDAAVAAHLSPTSWNGAASGSDHGSLGTESSGVGRTFTRPVTAARSDTLNSLDKRHPEDRKVTRFRKLLKHNERGKEPGRSGGVTALHRAASDGVSGFFRNNPHHVEAKLDAVFAVVIVLNSLFMALEMDADKHPSRNATLWLCLSIGFSALFLFELVCRLWIKGVRVHFCGKDHILNLLDALLVATDTVQVICILSLGAEAMSGVPAASLFRLFRIFRLTRIARMLNAPVFKDLLTIVQGLRGGLVTLGWSFLPFFLVLYTACLVCRETFGQTATENVSPYFDTVPRALLTMFRCGFGDFSSRTGVPIIEYVMDAHGLLWGFFYGLFVFFMSVGLFNVIAAVFLDSTLAATAELQKSKLQGRLADKELWYSRAFTIVKCLLPYTDCVLPDSVELSESTEAIMNAEIKRHDIARALRKKVSDQALSDLDIDPADRDILGDILDFSHTGRISILQFISGLKRLRGSDMRRSDVLSVDLMVRSLQEKVDEVLLVVRELEQRSCLCMHQQKSTVVV